MQTFRILGFGPLGSTSSQLVAKGLQREKEDFTLYVPLFTDD